MILQQREIPTGIEHQLQQYPQMLQKVFLARGVLNPAQVDLQLKHVLPPKDLPDIEVAAQRLVQAVRDDQHILIVGDFDADGATSVALCMRVLREFGAKHVNFVVPNRFEFGYGLSVEIVEHILPQQPDLIITVDNGVASVDGVDRARQAGVDVIVTDHHLPPDELPKAVAVVNPNLLRRTILIGDFRLCVVIYN